MTPWPSWLRRATVNRKIVSSILTGVEPIFWVVIPPVKQKSSLFF